MKRRRELGKTPKGTPGRWDLGIGKTYIIPVGFGELDGRGSPLNSSAVDKNMDLSSHEVERPLEEAFHRVEICQVALDSFDRAAGGSNGIGGFIIRRVGTPNETDVSPGLSESNRAGRTDACRDKGKLGRAVSSGVRGRRGVRKGKVCA